MGGNIKPYVRETGVHLYNMNMVINCLFLFSSYFDVVSLFNDYTNKDKTIFVLKHDFILLQ
jgi:hypothetical protein